MPLEQTITIVNNSGKIISSGKQLVSIFKEAKASYQNKKNQIKAERSIQRAQTFDPSRSIHRSKRDDDLFRQKRHDEYDEDDDYEYGYGREKEYFVHDRDYEYVTGQSLCDQSVASSRRSRSTYAKHGARSRHDDRKSHTPRTRPALTETNLKTMSEASSTSPSRVSRPPVTYRSPYAETQPRDMALSKMDLSQVDGPSRPPFPRRHSMSFVDMAPPRRRSAPDELGGEYTGRKVKEIDMDLAYGEIPPDLADRIDLDPVYQAQMKEDKAKSLVRKIEELLDEAHCVQHSAGATIKHLQQNPDTAAAVALSLAELSSIVTKMSPAFLTFLKGGSPAVFGLLASPHFLIGTSVVVGVTVVMFGGWKIVKRVKEAQAAREAAAMAFEAATPMDRPIPLRTQSDAISTGVDQAVVLDDDLSSIESWRRGIMPMGDDESADIELITPEALRLQRARHHSSKFGDDDFDVRSRQSGRTARTSKTVKTDKTDKTHKTTKTAKTTKSVKSSKGKEPERPSSSRRSSHLAATAESVVDTEIARRKPSSAMSTTSSTHSHKKSRSSHHQSQPQMKLLEDGRSRRGDDDDLEAAFRAKANRQGDNMLKALFKNKKDKDRSSSRLVLA